MEGGREGERGKEKRENGLFRCSIHTKWCVVWFSYLVVYRYLDVARAGVIGGRGRGGPGGTRFRYSWGVRQAALRAIEQGLATRVRAVAFAPR